MFISNINNKLTSFEVFAIGPLPVPEAPLNGFTTNRVGAVTGVGVAQTLQPLKVALIVASGDWDVLRPIADLLLRGPHRQLAQSRETLAFCWRENKLFIKKI